MTTEAERHRLPGLFRGPMTKRRRDRIRLVKLKEATDAK